MTKLPHAIWLRAFDSASRLGSFSQAAEELNLTPAAVSQQIKLLEQHLGVQLFTRLPRGVTLTRIGHAYAQPIRKSFAEMHEATVALFDTRHVRTVRVHASISFATLVLAPALSNFQRDHPDIEVQLSTAVWTDRSEDDSADVEIRYGSGDWSEPNIRHLGHRYATLVCHPEFAACFKTQPSLTELSKHAIQVIGSESDWNRMAEHHGQELPPLFGATKVDSSLIALQIAAGGMGITIASEEFSKTYLDQGLLVSPFEYRLLLPRSFFLIPRENADRRPEINLFCIWLANQFSIKRS